MIIPHPAMSAATSIAEFTNVSWVEPTMVRNTCFFIGFSISSQPSATPSATHQGARKSPRPQPTPICPSVQRSTGPWLISPGRAFLFE